jgi:hypothetical protein
MSGWVNQFLQSRLSEAAADLPKRQYQHHLWPVSVKVPNHPMKRDFLEEWLALGDKTLADSKCIREQALRAGDSHKLLSIGSSPAVVACAAACGANVVYVHTDLDVLDCVNIMRAENENLRGIEIFEEQIDLSTVTEVFIAKSFAVDTNIRRFVLPLSRSLNILLHGHPEERALATLAGAGYVRTGMGDELMTVQKVANPVHSTNPKHRAGSLEAQTKFDSYNR